MSEIVREIASQPALWLQAASRAEASAKTLPAAGARIAVMGCGTSLYMAQAIAALRETAGRGETDAFAASEVPPGRRYDAVVAISRSGTTTEVVRALDALPEGVPSLAVTAVPGTPVAEAAKDAIVLDFADERSVVQTRFATCALAMFRAHLGENLAPVASDGEKALAAEYPVDVADFDHYVFLGRGWCAGLANEAALKFREAAAAWTEAYPAMEYRHGPISVATERTIVWAFGEVESELLAQAAETGATVVSNDAIDPMAELIVVQRTAVALAEHRGLDPDHPRHLTRSVVLS